MSTDSLENFSIKYLIICYRIYIVDITLCPSTKHQSAAKFYGNAFRNQDDPTAYGSTLKNEYDPTVYGIPLKIKSQQLYEELQKSGYNN